FTDNTGSAGSSVQNAVSTLSTQWAAVGLELRAPKWTWSTATTAATMAPPALDPWANLVIQGSNDTDLYGMRETDGAQAFAPAATGRHPPFAPGNMRISSSTPYVDSADNVAWVTSRSAGGTGRPSLWKINATTGALYAGGVDNQDRWSLADIDASPIPSSDGQFIYVGTKTTPPTLNAICVYGPPTSALCTTAGQVFSYPAA